MSEFDICEDRSKLLTIENSNGRVDLNAILTALRQDFVVLARNLTPRQADETLYRVAHELGLGESLELQAGFAGFLGHRHNIGKYFMSVNTRSDYQFVPPHSEGTSFTNMQLASFYCYENSTDGGESILMNVDSTSTAWQTLREHVTRARSVSRRLSSAEIARASALHHLRLPGDLLRDDDQIVAEKPSKVSGLTLVEVLAKSEKTHSRILDQSRYAYWDSVSSVDHDSATDYTRLLKHWGLIKEPAGGLQVHQMDSVGSRRIWHSGIKCAQILKSRITHKLIPGDLFIQNNVTWTHAANNWSPGSGTRKVAAAFA